jgi:hypothetical protein
MRAPIILLLAVQALGQDLISSDTAFYGESPAVYPSREYPLIYLKWVFEQYH